MYIHRYFNCTKCREGLAAPPSLSLCVYLSQMFIKIMLTILQIHVAYSDIAVYIHVHGYIEYNYLKKKSFRIRMFAE